MMTNMIKLFPLLLAALLAVQPSLPVLAGDIYTWTDENGVKRFSDSPPEDDGATNIQVTPPPQNTETGKKTERNIDAERDRLIRQLKARNRARESRKQRQQEKTTQKQRAEASALLKANVQAEKKRLQSEIDRIQKLAVGPSLSIARKNAMLKPYKDRLKLLETAPETYFQTSSEKDD